MTALSRPSRRAFLTAAALAGTAAVAPIPAARAEITGTDSPVTIHEFEGEAGFTHPGISLTAATLRNLRTQVAAGAEPWASYAAHLAASSRAQAVTAPRNRDGADPTRPRTTRFDSRGTNSFFIEDALIAYTQAVMFVITGDARHRRNAMEVIRLWAQMDPSSFATFPDAHIHTGVPMQRMATAAELLRCTSAGDGSEEWTDELGEEFGENLVRPVIETFQSSNDHFMNQHTYPLLGAMAGAVFLEDRALYERGVEWFTVNATAHDQGFNGSILRLFRWVDRDDSTGEVLAQGRVQHVEMGRDQAHGGGDLNNAWELARMMMAQGTRVDPRTGAASTAADAVGPYEFSGDRILAAADYFWSYMLGHDPQWTPVAYAISPDGTVRDTYRRISPAYRGRFLTTNFWDLVTYYRYERGEDLETLAPHLWAAFRMRFEDRFHYRGSLTSAWENVDGGGDFWLHLPPAAAADGSALLPRPTPGPDEVHLADRATVLAGDVSIERPQGQAPYLHVAAGKEPARVSVLSAASPRDLVALQVRTDGVAQLRIGPDTRALTLPDTDGLWRLVTLAGGFADHQELEVLAERPTRVDIGALRTDAESALTPPAFPEDAPHRVIGVAGAALRIDLGAQDAEGETLVHAASALPDGAVLDAATGELTLAHPRPDGGLTRAVVQADDGTTMTAREVEIGIAPNRDAAIDLACTGHDPAATYVSWSLAAWEDRVAQAREAAPAADAETFAALLAELVTATADLELLSPRREDGSLDYAGLVVASTLGMPPTAMTDDDPGSFAWYGMAQDLTHTIDLGPDFMVRAEAFSLQSNIFPDRLATSIVLGSVDGQEWTRLTPQAARLTQDLQRLEVDPALRGTGFRWLRIHLTDPQPDVLYGIVRNLMEVSEFHIHGERVETGNVFERVTLSSEDAIAGKVRLGDTVTCEVVSRVELASLEVRLGGTEADVELAADGRSAIATAVVADGGTGRVQVEVTGTRTDGTRTPTLSATTDGTGLQVGGDVERQVVLGEDASIVASAPQWPGGALDEHEVAALVHDRDPETFGDLTQGAGAFYRIDLAAGAVAVEELCALPRASHPQRLDGARLQGSADGTTWVDISAPITGARAGTWSRLRGEAILSSRAWPHLRLINDAGWNGNLAEIELYGQVTA